MYFMTPPVRLLDLDGLLNGYMEVDVVSVAFVQDRLSAFGASLNLRGREQGRRQGGPGLPGY
jgi:hypothetical protein